MPAARLLTRLGLITAVTSAAGAFLAVNLPETLVKLVVGLSMAAVVVFMAARAREKHLARRRTPTRRIIGYAAATVLGVYGGFFSGGYTTLMTVLCVATFGLTMMESVAMTKPVNLVSCAAASVVFFADRLSSICGSPCPWPWPTPRRLARRPQRPSPW